MTTIGIIFLIIGVFVLVAGWQSVPKNGALMGAGAMGILGGTFIGIGGNPARDMPNGSPAMVVFGFMLFAGCVVITVLQLKKAKGVSDKVREDKLLEIGSTPLDRFFVECVLSGCNDFSKPKNVERAKLLAQKYSLAYPEGVEALYRKGFEEHRKISGKFDSDRLDEVREQERQQYAELNKYSSYTGRGKKIAILTDRMKELREKAKSLENGAQILMRATQQKESDWAIWGGIADGLAGPAAGISIALDIQARNAQVRADNESRMRAAMPAYMAVTSSASQNRQHADEIQAEINAVREKLVSEEPADKVLSMLKVSDVTVDVSETGAILLTATVSAKNKLYIFDDVPAVADGTIIAHVKCGGSEVAQINLVLPVNGVASPVGVAGIALSGGVSGKEYTVTYSAQNLWLMEK